MSGSTKNTVKLLLCQFDLGDCGGLCGKGYQKGYYKKRTSTLVVRMVREVGVVKMVRMVGVIGVVRMVGVVRVVRMVRVV